MRMSDCFPYYNYLISYSYCLSACIVFIVLQLFLAHYCKTMSIFMYITYHLCLHCFENYIKNLKYTADFELRNNSKILDMVGNMIWPVFIIEF